MILLLQHIDIEGPGYIAEFLNNSTYDIEIVRLFKGERIPLSFNTIDAAVILGGPMNVYEEDRYPFLREEHLFLKQSLEKKIPLLGICLGAQLIAKAAGGMVVPAPKRERGWCRVQLITDGVMDPLFRGMRPELDVFQWHDDTVILPDGAVLLATGRECRNQAFRMGDNAYGLQFHVEVTPEMIMEWQSAYAPSGSGGDVISGARQICRRDAETKQMTFDLFLNFMRIVEISGMIAR